MAHEHHAHVHHSHVKSYLTVYVVLLVLVIATVAAAFTPLGPLAFPVCMAIAVAKAFLIIWIFMHVKDETPLIRVFAFVGFTWFGILLTFLLSDYLTRTGFEMPARVEARESAREYYLEHGGHHQKKFGEVGDH